MPPSRGHTSDASEADGVGAIEKELGALRAALEAALAQSDVAAARRARRSLFVALACYGSPEFDLEARFHLAELGTSFGDSPPLFIAASLVQSETAIALQQLAEAIEDPAADPELLLKLTFSSLMRMGGKCPEVPWLTDLLRRLDGPAERGASAAQLLGFLSQGGATRQAVASMAAEAVAELWKPAPQFASGVLDMLVRALVDANDQRLLALTTANALRSLPPGHASERNTTGYLLITSLAAIGDRSACVGHLDDLLSELVSEPWDRSNFGLVTHIAVVAADVAAGAFSDNQHDEAAAAVAVADRTFGVIERIDGRAVMGSDAERQDVEQRLSKAFSRAAAVTRSLSGVGRLEISRPNPAPLFRFQPEGARTTSSPDSPGQAARISEARFLEACARANWKAIPTPLEVDFGLDYRIEIPETPGRTSADVEFLVQLKSTSATANKSGLLTASIDAMTLKYWKSKVLPTLVVLYHHPSNSLYTAWYLPALDDPATRTFRFAREDEWDPITIQIDVQRYYQHVRAALASGGDWSVLSVMQAHCALLIKLLLTSDDLRRAALDPAADMTGAVVDQALLTLLSMHHRALCAPAPILAGQPECAGIVGLLGAIDAIVRSWTLGGPQVSRDVRFTLVATRLLLESARDLLHVAVELDCALAAAIVNAQEDRSAALSATAAGPKT